MCVTPNCPKGGCPGKQFGSVDARESFRTSGNAACKAGSLFNKRLKKMCCNKLSEGAAAKFAELDAFIDGLGIDRNDERRRGRLIQVLHRAQDIFGYLPREVQIHVAKKLFLSEAQVSGVVSFYNYFTTEPKGKYNIDICMGTACYVKGAETVLRELERVLGVKADTCPTPDGLFSINALRCVGACGLAPVMMVNGKVYGKVTPAKAVEIINEYKKQG